ncbi:MAG TPA: hypothetical protein VFH19_03635 [Nitrososphaeraceae archaeon]|jgi:hypothetical protein|nr:hypothetical protein [Nitrososphaeraceae archaeon]
MIQTWWPNCYDQICGDFPLPPLTSDDTIKEPKVPNDLGGLQDEDENPTINHNLP